MTKFGLQIPNFTFADVPDREMFEHVADLAVAGEQAGFDSVWVMDHFWQLPPLGGPTQPMLEAYTLLGGLAARTRRVKLGTLVTGVTYRNPALLAKMVTTLDIVSSGRAMLGLGAAWYEEEHDAFGFDFPSAGKRLDRLEEALQICRAMFTEEAPSFAGKHSRIEKAMNIPRPVQPNGPRDHGRRKRREAHAAARRAVRRHVQHQREPRHHSPSARSAARPLRRRRPRPERDHDDAPRVAVPDLLGGGSRADLGDFCATPPAPISRSASRSETPAP